MTEREQNPGNTGPDDEIASRFAQMRAREAASAPAFSPTIEPASAQQVRLRPWTVRRTSARVAAAIVLVAITATLLREKPQEDPAVIYAGIMKNQQVQTDALLHVSASVLPASSPLPRLYDIEAEVDAGMQTN